MKILKLLILILCLFSGSVQAYEPDTGFKFQKLSQKSSNEVRVVWWNILQGGKLSDEIEKKEHHHPLQVNLDSLTQPSQKPEFLILGEYRPTEIKPEIDQMLRARYRHAIFIPYSSTYSYQGVFILSDQDMKIFTHHVGWGDQATRDEWAKIYPASQTSFDRSFIAIRYQWNNETQYILPFHSVQPWMPLKATYPERFSKLYTALEILTGTHNPLFNQLSEYFMIMKKVCDPEKNKVLMIGDLNTPDSLMGLKPIGYQLLTWYLDDAFIRGSSYTFPAPSSVNTGLSPSSQRINQIRIDHALSSANQKTKDARRLPLRGSDHFPISVTITN